jgi:hypothetical protein
VYSWRHSGGIWAFGAWNFYGSMVFWLLVSLAFGAWYFMGLCFFSSCGDLLLACICCCWDVVLLDSVVWGPPILRLMIS